jgi:hypothetical protein
VVEHDPISPELALIDPELRSEALESLARAEAGRVWAPYAPIRLPRPEPQVPARRRSMPVLVAALLYLCFGLFQVALWGLLLVSVLVISITATVLIP